MVINSQQTVMTSVVVPMTLRNLPHQRFIPIGWIAKGDGVNMFAAIAFGIWKVFAIYSQTRL